MKNNLLQKVVSPWGLVILCVFIIFLWFKKGLFLAGGEEQLSFYNYSKSFNLFYSTWYSAGTGYPDTNFLIRIPYYFFFTPLYNLGISNVVLQAFTFLLLLIIGTLSVYFITIETVSNYLQKELKKIVPFLAALFYILNPFSLTQIWGRAVSFQFFAFALVPSFLLFYILAIIRKNIIYCIFAVLISFFLSIAYSNPAIVITSWAPILLYLIFYILKNLKDYREVLWAVLAFCCLLLMWVVINFFWIYPMINHGNELLTQNFSERNVLSLKLLAPQNNLLNVIRLIHVSYYNGVYGEIYKSPFYLFISWLLPIFVLFSIPVLKKTPFFSFIFFLLLVSIVICIGANFPTGFLFIWFFEKITILQALRNPYEKFGINLALASSPFFALGLINFSEKLSMFYKNKKLTYYFVAVFAILYSVILVWPMWKGNFAGGIKTNNWVEIPSYYKDANNWLNSIPEDFNILHVPLIPGDGVTYKWENFFEGIESSEFLFDKGSIARNFEFNNDYYFALLDRFGAREDYYKYFRGSLDNSDFKDNSLIAELAKLNIRFIILHSDTDDDFRGAKSYQETKVYLENHDGIRKVKTFGKLEIYQVDIPDRVRRIYSPEVETAYHKINNTHYLVDVKDAKYPFELYFLQQYHPGWEATIDQKRVDAHNKIFSYANSWTVERIGNYTITIKYKPQQFFITAWSISRNTFFASVIFILTLLIIRKLRRGKLFS